MEMNSANVEAVVKQVLESMLGERLLLQQIQQQETRQFQNCSCGYVDSIGTL